MTRKRVIDMRQQPLEDRALLLEVVRALVDRPEHVRIAEHREDDVLILTLHVARGDRGRVIGRKGRIISALRQLFTSIGRVDGQKVLVKIAD